MPEPSSSSPDPRHARTVDLLGAEGFARLRAARVAVFGLGGVGGHAAVALARAGIGTLTLVDFDAITRSSLNRSAFATPADVGQPKALALERFLAAIDPGVAVEARVAFFHEESAEALLAGPPDLVIDAIDSFTPKVALLRLCVERGLRVVSCMGASARTDPLALRIGKLAETRVCPLARVVRKRLGRFGIREGIACVYSIEPPLPPLPPDEEDETLRRGRVRRRLPSLGTLPGIFGYAAANLAIRWLSELPVLSPIALE
jgi:tRNA A37 threonylcarbamoyladenosine dehydratase